MRQQGSNQRRPRGRANRKPQLSPRSQTFDSNGPDVRVRGNAHQVHDKYLSLARDAASSGDRIAAESYYQFAEHYFRLLNDSTDPPRPGDPQRGQRDRGPHPRDGRDGRPQGPPAEQPVVDMGYQPPMEPQNYQERRQGRRANGHEAGAIAGEAPVAARAPEAAAGAADRPAEPRAEQPAEAAATPPAEQPAAEPAERPRERPPMRRRRAEAEPKAQPPEAAEAAAPSDQAAAVPEVQEAGADEPAAEAPPPKRAPAKRRPRRKAANGAADKDTAGGEAAAEPKAEGAADGDSVPT